MNGEETNGELLQKKNACANQITELKTRKEENEYSYINGIRVGIHQNGYGIWKYSLNGELCLQNYQSKENAIIGALEAMMEIKE